MEGWMGGWMVRIWMKDSTHYYTDPMAPENQAMVFLPQAALSLADSFLGGSPESVVRDGLPEVYIAHHQSNASRKRKIPFCPQVVLKTDAK